jgi:hypothetical protein
LGQVFEFFIKRPYDVFGQYQLDLRLNIKMIVVMSTAAPVPEDREQRPEARRQILKSRRSSPGLTLSLF